MKIRTRYAGVREQVVSSVHMSAVEKREEKKWAEREGVITWKREGGRWSTQCLQKGGWEGRKQAQASEGAGSVFTAQCDPRHLSCSWLNEQERPLPIVILFCYCCTVLFCFV